MERIGLFICTGCQIGDALALEDLDELLEEHDANVVKTVTCKELCGAEGVAQIAAAIDGGEIDGVLLAACSPRAKTEAFSFDPQAVGVERVALREQVAWSQPHRAEDTEMLAADLLRMGLARLAKNKLPTPLDESVETDVLVVGGGLAGLSAARAAVGLGHRVLLVERERELGGSLRHEAGAIPRVPPYDRVHDNDIADLVREAQELPGLRVTTSTKILRIAGQPGQLEVELEGPHGRERLRVGAIVQATGARPYDASKLTALGYGKLKDVVTAAELDRMLAAGTLERRTDGKAPRRVIFVQCAGSRDAEHLPYCSSVCCATTVRQVGVIHRDFPDVECAVVYRDMRTPGQLEHFYLAAQDHPQSMFARGVVTQVKRAPGGRLTVKVDDTPLAGGAPGAVELEADLVVLALGMVPNAADGPAIRELWDSQARAQKGDSEVQRQKAAARAEELICHEDTEILNLDYRQGPDLPTLRYGFPDSHYICFPYETRRTGIYAAGTVRAPMDPAQAEEDGWGAAMKAVQCVSAAARGEAVHPRAGDVGAADFFLQRCTQCKRCTEECPFGSINEDAKGTPQYNPLRCRRCGICLGACPERIISFPDYSVDAVASMIKAMEVPDEDEEKPRIVALMCENDALPALDKAAKRGAKWNPWVRVIPVRCLGAVNTVWIADALSRGIDGMVLIGCRKGDDYQCHYIQGSELAAKRMENVQETLDRLSLEPERVEIVELAHDEFDRIPQVLDDFAKVVDEVGANPYKGF